MRPLVVITTYNRQSETEQTLRALEETTDLSAIQLVVMDNGSTDGTAEFLESWQYLHHHLSSVAVHLLHENIGCPQALNLAMEAYRKPGQAMIKLDNDVAIETPGWLYRFEQFLEAEPQVVMLGPWYDELTEEKRLGKRVKVQGFHYYRAWPLIGHMVYHAGSFLDQVGYFDVLAEDHLYGFEDLILCQKAAKLGYELAVLPEVKVRMLQRKNALDVAGPEGRDEHVERLRPEYNRRVAMIRGGEYIFTDEGGQPK